MDLDLDTETKTQKKSILAPPLVMDDDMSYLVDPHSAAYLKVNSSKWRTQVASQFQKTELGASVRVTYIPTPYIARLYVDWYEKMHPPRGHEPLDFDTTSINPDPEIRNKALRTLTYPQLKCWFFTIKRPNLAIMKVFYELTLLQGLDALRQRMVDAGIKPVLIVPSSTVEQLTYVRTVNNTFHESAAVELGMEEEEEEGDEEKVVGVDGGGDGQEPMAIVSKPPIVIDVTESISRPYGGGGTGGRLPRSM